MTGGLISQRDRMRELSVQFDGDREKVCAAYAQAERDGAVSRHRNTHNMAPEDYAAALWEDGVKKGWLKVAALPIGPDTPPTISPDTDRVKSLSVAELLVLHAQIGEEPGASSAVRTIRLAILPSICFAAPSDGRKPRTPKGDMTPPDQTAHATRSRVAASTAATSPASFLRSAI